MTVRQFDFNDAALCSQIEELFQTQIAPGDDSVLAYTLYRGVERYFAEHPRYKLESPQLAERYQHLHLLAGWVALYQLHPEEIETFFRDRFPLIFEIPEYNIQEKLREHLLHFDFQVRDAERLKIRRAMLESRAKLTQASLVSKGYEVRGTVAAWLEDFLAQTAPDESTEIDTYRINKYLSSSANTRSLLTADRERVGKLVQFFSYLSLSSDNVRGMEDEFTYDSAGKTYRFRNGRTEEVAPTREVVATVSTLIPREDSRSVVRRSDMLEAEELSEINRQSAEKGSERFDELVFSSARSIVRTVRLADSVYSSVQELIKLHLREIRDSVETRERLMALTKDPANKLTEADVDKIMAAAKAKKKELRMMTVPAEGEAVAAPLPDRPMKVMPPQAAQKHFNDGFEPLVKAVPDPRRDRSRPVPTDVVKPPTTTKPSAPILDASHELMPPLPVVAQPSPTAAPKPLPKPQPTNQSTSVVKSFVRPAPLAPSVAASNPRRDNSRVAPIVPPLPKPAPTPKPVATKPFPSSVPLPPRPKPPATRQPSSYEPPKLSKNSLDELATFDLQQFRLPRGTAADRARKIVERLNLLAREGVLQKDHGKGAWRSSPVYRAYVDIGRQSLLTGKPIAAVVTDMEKAGKKTLTAEEFGAVMQINREIDQI